jgi:hypothetical protein
MLRHYLFLSLLVLAALLAGCTPEVAAQPGEVKALENLTTTDVSEKTALIQTETPEIVSHDPSANCPITISQDPPFTAPTPYSPNSPFDTNFWYGSTSLWTNLPKDGIWYALPQNPEGYTQRVFWWRDGYVWNEEPQPDLVVTGERLDAAAPPLVASRATNAYAGDIGSAMLVGVDFPTLGCWKITGQYREAELSFVVWVAP